jgi:integrin alpha 7
VLFSFADIAVGAPYEGNGAVYIYHGSVDGIKHEPSQIIRAENIDPRIKGFGISLSKGADVDGNHYNGT